MLITARCFAARSTLRVSVSGSSVYYKISTIRGTITVFLLSEPVFLLHGSGFNFFSYFCVCVCVCFSSLYSFLCFWVWQSQQSSQPEKWTWLESLWLLEEKLWTKPAFCDYDECGKEMCNLPVEGIADAVLMSFPKTWRISECILALCGQINGGLSLKCFFFLFISLKMCNKEYMKHFSLF